MELILISGLAGAGKSTALRILEDNDYYCIDNLPPSMLLQLIQTYLPSEVIKKIAVGVDTRSYLMLKQLPSVITEIISLGIQVKVVYLEAKPEVLVKRFSETRRKHPLSDGNKTIIDCIQQEQAILSNISNIAHRIDTSDLSANGLRSIIKQFVNADYSQLNIVIQSFGFKYGLPIDSDFVFDVRCLPNPYYNLEIREFTGNDQPVIDFLSGQAQVKQMIDDIYTYLSKWIDKFSLDNRNYITISIGCTGGKHRSVYISNCLAKLIKPMGYKILVRHRQLDM
jgi:UPF0042 nucleotide-binding protein